MLTFTSVYFPLLRSRPPNQFIHTMDPLFGHQKSSFPEPNFTSNFGEFDRMSNSTSTRGVGYGVAGAATPVRRAKIPEHDLLNRCFRKSAIMWSGPIHPSFPKRYIYGCTEQDVRLPSLCCTLRQLPPTKMSMGRIVLAMPQISTTSCLPPIARRLSPIVDRVSFLSLGRRLLPRYLWSQ